MQDTHEYLVNTKFPEFYTYDDKRKIITEKNLYGKWSVIFFYPKDESPGCTLQSCSFRDKYEEFNDLGVQIFGVSSDSVSSHRKFKEKHNLQYSLLSDKGGILAKNLKLKKNLGLIAARVTLIINPEGFIIYAHTSQLGVMGHVRKVLNEIKVREINI
jgi:peroxiredoxin Q/BCP|tara:strand:+ start:194 stop:667 length:474 start_codon:yes stop_codon:yes gene_type:complete